MILKLLLFTVAALAREYDTPHTRSFFDIDGTYVPSPTNATEHLFVDQMYVEQLTPYPPARAAKSRGFSSSTARARPAHLVLLSTPSAPANRAPRTF